MTHFYDTIRGFYVSESIRGIVGVSYDCNKGKICKSLSKSFQLPDTPEPLIRRLVSPRVRRLRSQVENDVKRVGEVL